MPSDTISSRIPLMEQEKIFIFGGIFFGALLFTYALSYLTQRLHKKEDLGTELEASVTGVRSSLTHKGMLILFVFMVTLIAFIAIIWIAFFGPEELTKAQEAVHTTLNTVVTAGTGALFGLLASSN